MTFQSLPTFSLPPRENTVATRKNKQINNNNHQEAEMKKSANSKSYQNKHI